MKYRFLIVSLTALAILGACSPAKSSTNEKNRFDEYEIVNNQQIRWDEIFLKENRYIVFFYSETCLYCHEMMNQIISFANDGILPTYFLDTEQNIVTFKEEEPPLGYVPIAEFFIVGTPSIVEIDDKLMTAHVYGLDDCLTYLNDRRMEANIIL